MEKKNKGQLSTAEKELKEMLKKHLTVKIVKTCNSVDVAVYFAGEIIASDSDFVGMGSDVNIPN